MEDRSYQHLRDETRDAELIDNYHSVIQETLDHLGEDYWTVLVLRFFSGLSLEETSTVMNRSPGEIRVLQHHALLAFHNLLGL